MDKTVLKKVIIYSNSLKTNNDIFLQWKYTNVAIVINSNGAWLGNEAYSSVVGSNFKRIDMIQLIRIIYEKFKSADIIIINERAAIPENLVKEFFAFSGQKSYLFCSGLNEVSQDFSLERISYSFFCEVLKQDNYFLSNGLLNGGDKYCGNKFRFWINNRFREEIFKREDFALFPLAYNVDLTRRCNVRCTKCPNHGMDPETGDYYDVKKKWRTKLLDLDIDLFRKILDEGDPKSTIYISVSGESLLYPNYKEALKLLYKHNRPFCYTSNATLLKQEVLQEMLDHGLVSLTISLDAYHESTYKKVVPKADFSKTIKNVENAVKLISEYNKSIHLAYVLIPGINDDGEFKSFFDRWINDVNYVTKNYFAPPKSVFKKYKYNDLNLPKERLACIQPYHMLVVATDGLVSACCRDYDTEMAVGDLTKENLSEIWRGRRLQQFRGSMFGEKPLHPTCADCWMWSIGTGYYKIEGGISIYTDKDQEVYSKISSSNFSSRSRIKIQYNRFQRAIGILKSKLLPKVCHQVITYNTRYR